MNQSQFAQSNRSLRFAMVIIGCLLSPLALAEDLMELHLVLAFDASASVNDVEFDLQRRGTAYALRSDLVAAAIDDAPGGVAIAIVQWSSVTRQALTLDWVVLRTRNEATAYADVVEAMPRRLPGGGTMIHAGLEFAAKTLDAAPGQARRRVIDVSGNGVSDDAPRLQETRRVLLANGIVINGLAIEEDDLPITDYYRRHLIGGPSAFVITAEGFEDFAKAMEMKLYREIAGAIFAKNN